MPAAVATWDAIGVGWDDPIATWDDLAPAPVDDVPWSHRIARPPPRHAVHAAGRIAARARVLPSVRTVVAAHGLAVAAAEAVPRLRLPLSATARLRGAAAASVRVDDDEVAILAILSADWQ